MWGLTQTSAREQKSRRQIVAVPTKLYSWHFCAKFYIFVQNGAGQLYFCCAKLCNTVHYIIV